MANEEDEIALAAGFNPQHAEAVFGVVEADAVNQARRDLRQAIADICAILPIKIRGRYSQFILLTRSALITRG
jgi:hypothetical protein